MKNSNKRALYYKLIHTPIGWVGPCGSEVGLSRLQLPEKSLNETRRKLLAYIQEVNADAFTTSLPAWFNVLEKKLQDLFLSKKVDFTNLPLDIQLTPFQSRVLEKLKSVPQGQIITYKDLALSIDAPKASRAVGMALGKNPVPIVIPCHRVVPSNNKSIGGFTAYKGTELKIKLLKYEGINLENRK